MELNRRTLLSGLAAGITLPAFRTDTLRRVAEAARAVGPRSSADFAGDEAYWSEITRAFDADRTLVNLNNGGCSPTPSPVLEAMIRDLRFSNEIPVHHMWNMLEPRIESVRRDLAAEFGCDPEEMAIVRNASEVM
jgi:isopenicillin-N epimerase